MIGLVHLALYHEGKIKNKNKKLKPLQILQKNTLFHARTTYVVCKKMVLRITFLSECMNNDTKKKKKKLEEMRSGLL